MEPPFLLPRLLRAAPVAVASLDLEGCILDANPALLGPAGYSLEELRGRSFGEFLERTPSDARSEFEALASGSIDAFRAERRFRSGRGTVHDVDLSVSLVRDETGRPQSCLAVLQDVTTHKTALREAARRAAELEAVIQSIPAAVYIGDETGVKIVNKTGLDQLGFSSVDELNNRIAEVADTIRARDVQSGERVPPEQLAFVRALRGEHVHYEEVMIRHLQTGADRINSVTAAPIVLDGRIAGAVAINIDVTEQRDMEEALRLSEARYRGLVEQSPLSVQILAPDGRTLLVNKAWERLWGLTLEQIADYNLLQDPQLVARGLMPHLRRAFDGEPAQVPAALYDPDETLPDRSVHRDARRWVRAVIYPLKGRAGVVREVVLIHEDISEQVRADEQRQRIEQERERLLADARRAHSEAEAANRVKDEFLAVLSHELRTPLNAVLGWARILRSRPLGDQTAHAIDVIERNAAAQARLIDELLDMSRIITGKIRLHTERVDLVAAAREALETVKPAADARRIQIDLRVEEHLPAVTADPQRLQQVFWNLLSNAVKFTQQGGQVSVTLSATPDAVKAEVSDNGAGIPAEILPYVFDRFTQGDSSSTRAHPGLGLGLAIVRHLVELHGGTVHVESRGSGQGASFSFTLPR